MEKVICGLLFIAALSWLVYKIYRFFARNEISTCFGEHYRWKDGREETKGAQYEEARPKSPLK